VNGLKCRKVDVQIDASVSGKMTGSRHEVGLRLLKEAIMEFGHGLFQVELALLEGKEVIPC
jgi:hypothetical protein